MAASGQLPALEPGAQANAIHASYHRLIAGQAARHSQRTPWADRQAISFAGSKDAVLCRLKTTLAASSLEIV